MSKKLGLALGSGGSRGVTHIGVLRALEEEGIKPDYISGSSMGAVVGACYSKGMTIDEMLEVVLKLKTLDLVDLSAAPISQSGLLKGRKMQRLLLSNIGDVQFSDLKIPFSCVASDVLSGELVELSEGSVATAVRASSSIPTIFRPVEIQGRVLVDGGVMCRVPFEQVKRMGADVVIGVDALVNTKAPVDNVHNIISMILRVYDIMDYRTSSLKMRLDGGVCDLMLEPEMKGLNQYVVKDMDKAYLEGYDCAKANMDKIKELLK
jgi:NTE family protein